MKLYVTKAEDRDLKKPETKQTVAFVEVIENGK